MNGTFYPASKGRLLVITPRSDVSKVLLEQTDRPVVALLTAHSIARDSAELETVILSLLQNGCGYFVCFGSASEALHDWIDELVDGRMLSGDSAIITTWHDDETAAEVAEFFFNVAAEKEKSLLVAVLEPSDRELASLLVRHASD